MLSGLKKCHMNFLLSRNFNAFENKKPCLRVSLEFERHYYFKVKIYFIGLPPYLKETNT